MRWPRATSRSPASCTGPRRDRRARRLRRGRSVLRDRRRRRAPRAAPTTSGAVRRPTPSSGCASGSGDAWRVAAIGPAGERLVRYATHLARRPPRRPRRSGRRPGLEAVKAIAVRAATKVGLGRPGARSWPRRRICARARSARRPPSTASWARSRTCSPSTRSPRCRRATSRRRRSTEAEAARRPRSSPRCASVARNCCASCTIGCEHIYSEPRTASSVRMEYENVFALGPLCGVDDPDAVLAASATLRRARARHDLGRRHDRVGDGVRRARADRRAVAALRRRRGAAARDRGDRRARGARRAARRGLAPRGARSSGSGSEAFAAHVKGLELPGYEPRTLQAMALGLAVNARGADHNRSGAYEADLSGRARPAARRRARTCRRDRDRGPRGDHGLADPLQVPARRVRRPDAEWAGCSPR